MQEDPECKTEYIPLLVPLGVLLRKANASRLIWDEYTKVPVNYQRLTLSSIRAPRYVLLGF